MLRKTSGAALWVGLAALLSLFSAPAGAQPWPAKPITIISGFPAGAGTDIVLRLYQEALEIELNARQILNDPQRKLRIFYKERLLEKFFVTDFVCFDCIVVELKAEKQLTGVDESQLLNQLKSTKQRVGLLINFGSIGKLEWKRFVN